MDYVNDSIDGCRNRKYTLSLLFSISPLTLVKYMSITFCFNF